MSNLVITVLFDLGLAVLLIATIVYCSKLSRRIRTLQDTRSELSGMISQFDTATDRAMTSVTELQTISKRITDALQLKIDKANFLADDLAFLIEKSTKMVAQLEQSRTQPQEKPVQKHTQEAKPSFEPSLNQLTKPKHVNQESIEAILQRLSSPEEEISHSGGGAHKVEPKLVPRTGAERELLEALKASR